MQVSHERAAGYDFANLWMNMAKIVIALLFVYQNALDSQLGVRLFQDYYYVFHVPVNPDREDEAAADVVTPDDPFFSIDFKPLALGQPYDEFVVTVDGLEAGSGEGLLRDKASGLAPCVLEDPTCVRFGWEELTGGDKAVLHRASFNLLELVRDESALQSGDYTVRFGFRFFRDGKPLPQRRSDSFTGTLKFLRQEELRFGDVPVVQGRPFRIPRLIRDRIRKGGSWGAWDAYREIRVLEGPAESWRSGSILNAAFDQDLLRPARNLTPGRTYEQRGHFFDENRVQVDFTIGFSLLRNESPRSTYLGPGESNVHQVRIFYEWHFYEEDQGYYYYNLSRHIIDPDGTTAPLDGRPDVRVAQFSNLRPENLPYRLQRDRLTGDWHLRVEGRIEDSLRPGQSHQLSVIATDDFQSQPIQIRIER